MAKQTFTTGQVLTADQMTSLQQTAMGGGSATAKTASYVLVAADAGSTVIMNSGSSTTITVNTALFAAGDTVLIVNQGAGVCTVTAGTATVNTAGSLALSQYETSILYFLSTSAAILTDYTQSGGMTNPMTTTGDTIYSSSGSTPARLGIGSTGQVLTVAAGLPSWATAAGGGKVLQVVQGTKTSNFTTTSSSYVDSGLSVSITPSSATSKVMIFVGGWAQIAYSGSTTTAQGSYNLVRTSTQLQSFQKGYYNFASSSSPEFSGPINLSYLDSPATTSATTYKMQVKSDSGASATIYLSASATQIASIVAMEIGA